MTPDDDATTRASAPEFSPFGNLDRAYLRSLSYGIHRFEIAILLVLAAAMAASIYILVAFTVFTDFVARDWRRLFTPLLLATLVVVLGSFLGITGLFSIYKKVDPTPWIPARAMRVENTRTNLRTLLAIFTICIFTFVSLLVGWTMNPTPRFLGFIDASRLAAALLSLPLFWYTADYLRDIALRIPDSELAERLVGTARATVILYLITILFALLSYPVTRVNSALPQFCSVIPMTSQVPVLILCAIALILTTIPLIYFFRHLRRLRRHTTAALASQPTPADDASQ